MPLPDRLGRLRRVDRLGVGGFATVWRYHDPELECDVAVKALAEHWAQRLDVRERFLDEARILRRAASEHVVTVHDVGETDGVPWFVMTYADRGSLADLLDPPDAVPLAPARVNDLVTQAGAGLAVLHEHGVVHRDVKPQNLLLRDGGQAGERLLVADLGVAKALLHASGLTQVVGTPAYMAPEQALGLGVDVRADVHALGAVAYHLLTGSVVREGTLGALAHAAAPRPPSELLAGTEPERRPAGVDPDALDAALLGALAPDPDDRWPDVASFVVALRAALPEPERTERESLTLWARPPARPGAPRRRAAALPTGRVLALLLLLVVVASFGVAYTTVTLIA